MPLISVDTLRKWLADGRKVWVVDVRPLAELEAGANRCAIT